jgi:hypothetical protein
LVRYAKDVKVDVTVNGSGFDNPSEISYEDDGDIPYCSMMFPGGIRSRYQIKKSDLVRVYIGLDDVPDDPTFTGYQTDETGISNANMEFSGVLFRAMKDYKRVTDFDNHDGQEIGNAIEGLVRNTSGLSWLARNVENTSPKVFVPLETRFQNGVSKFELMKEFRDLAVNPEDPLQMGRYTFFEYGGTFYFRSIPDPKTASAWFELAYGDTLLSLDHDSSSRFTINKAQVIGDTGVFNEFQNDHRLALDGQLEDQPITDKGILSDGEAREVARASVLLQLFPEIPLNIESHLLLHSIPKATVVEITDAPYGLSDKYLLRSKQINVSEGNFSVTGKVTTPVDVVSDALSKLIGLNRDLPITSTPAGA